MMHIPMSDADISNTPVVPESLFDLIKNLESKGPIFWACGGFKITKGLGRITYAGLMDKSRQMTLRYNPENMLFTPTELDSCIVKVSSVTDKQAAFSLLLSLHSKSSHRTQARMSWLLLHLIYLVFFANVEVQEDLDLALRLIREYESPENGEWRCTKRLAQIKREMRWLAALDCRNALWILGYVEFGEMIFGSELFIKLSYSQLDELIEEWTKNPPAKSMNLKQFARALGLIANPQPAAVIVPALPENDREDMDNKSIASTDTDNSSVQSKKRTSSRRSKSYRDTDSDDDEIGPESDYNESDDDNSSSGSSSGNSDSGTESDSDESNESVSDDEILADEEFVPIETVSLQQLSANCATEVENLAQQRDALLALLKDLPGSKKHQCGLMKNVNDAIATCQKKMQSRIDRYQNKIQQPNGEVVVDPVAAPAPAPKHCRAKSRQLW